MFKIRFFSADTATLSTLDASAMACAAVSPRANAHDWKIAHTVVEQRLSDRHHDKGTNCGVLRKN